MRLVQGGSPRKHSEADGPNQKRQRVVWTVEMHQQFVNAVNQLGIDSAWHSKLLRVECTTRHTPPLQRLCPSESLI